MHSNARHTVAWCQGVWYSLDLLIRGLVRLGMEGEILKGHLDMIVLAALAAGPAHGYGIIQEIRSRSGGAFDLPEGTVYPVLHRLEEAGFLSSRWTTGEAGRKRRVYSLTRKGSRALADRRARGVVVTRLAASWEKPMMPQSSPVADYLNELGRELAFDPALSRRVRQEVEDHLQEAVTAEPAEPTINAEKRAIMRFGAPQKIAEQYRIVWLYRRMKRTGLFALCAVLVAFGTMAGRVVWYGRTQWNIGPNLEKSVGTIIVPIDRCAFPGGDHLGNSRIDYCQPTQSAVLHACLSQADAPWSTADCSCSCGNCGCSHMQR